MRRLELEEERKKSEERKKTVIIKGIKVQKEGIKGLKKEVEKIVKVMGVTAKIEEIRRMRRKNREGREMVWVRFASFGEKLEVMKGKKLLRIRKKWITDDLTKKERWIAD